MRKYPSKKIYLSNIEHEVTTSKIPFYHFCLGSACLDIFENFLHVCKATTSTDKSPFKKLHFIAVAYDMRFISCALDVVYTAVFLPSFKQSYRN